MNLAQRARRATGLDVEDFATLLGVHFHVVEGWEDGSRRTSPPLLALFRIVAELPRQALDVLGRVRREREALQERIREALRRLGRGPRGVVPLVELIEAVAFRQTAVGREAWPGCDAAEVGEVLFALEKARELVLEPPRDGHPLDPREREAALNDPKRGLLCYASPGPLLGRG